MSGGRHIFDKICDTAGGPSLVSDEFHELQDQLTEKDHKVRDLASVLKRNETEKEEFQAALEEADATLEQSEVKLQRTNQELAELRQENERRLHDKEGDFESTRYGPEINNRNMKIQKLNYKTK